MIHPFMALLPSPRDTFVLFASETLTPGAIPAAGQGSINIRWVRPHRESTRFSQMYLWGSRGRVQEVAPSVDTVDRERKCAPAGAAFAGGRCPPGAARCFLPLCV